MSTTERAQIELWEPFTPLPGSETQPPEPPPTVRQIYSLARLLAERAGVDWPATRTDASALIGQLRAQRGR